MTEKFALGVKTSIFNSEVRKRRAAKGLSQLDMDKYLGLPRGTTSRLETFKEYPSYQRLEDIADFLESDVEALFPEWLREQKVKRSTYDREILVDKMSLEAPELKQIEAPAEIDAVVKAVDNQHLKKAITDGLELLTQRERKILRMRFGLDDSIPQSLDEVASEFGVTRERIRQIENKGLMKLRRSNRLLKKFMGSTSD